MQPKHIVQIGLLAAIMLIAQVALAALPNIELVSLLVILYTLHFKRKALYIIYIFVLAEGILYGFGMWWMAYLYIWTVLYWITRLLRHVEQPAWWAGIAGLFGLSFGALSSLPYLITAGPAGAVAYFIAGIPFDITHCIGNVLTALLLFRPLNRLLSKIAS